MNVLSDRTIPDTFFNAAANACSHVTKQKQRFTALFFVALLLFQGIAGFAPYIVNAADNMPDPLKQVEREKDLPVALAKAEDEAGKQKAKLLQPGETFTRKVDKTVVSVVPKDEYNTVTTYADGSQKIRSTPVEVNEKTDKGYAPISRRLNEVALTTQNAAGQQLDLTNIIKESSKFTKKAFNGKGKTRGVNFPTFEAGKGIELTSGDKTVTVYPQNANPLAIPVKYEGKTNDYVVYENLWNNVDLRYDYLGSGALAAATGLLGGGLIGKVAGNTKAIKAFMGVQAKMPIVGAKSVLFGMGSKATILGRYNVPTLGNRVLPSINKNRLRIGWHSGNNHMLEFAVRSGARHNKPIYRLPTNLNKNYMYRK